MEKHKKLVIVIWHLGIGGMQKRMTDIAEEMEEKFPNWKIFFLVKYRKDSPFEKRLRRLKNVQIDFFSDKKNNSPRFFYWLYKKWQIIMPEVCLTFLDHLSVGCVLLKTIFFNRTKIVLNESMLTSKYLETQRGGWSKFWKLAINFAYPRADIIIVPTEAIKLDLIKNFRIDASSIQVIPNWTNWPLGQSIIKDIDILFVGRFEKEKGYDKIKEIRKACHKFKVVTVGGNMMSDNVKKWIDRSKILILPTQNEGMPNVILEAGIRGVPSVTYNFAGVEEIINDGVDGIVVNSTEEMILGIEKLLGETKLRKSMGEKIQLKVKNNFGKNNQVEFIESLLD